MATLERRVRRLINDTRWADPVVSQDRLREMATVIMHRIGERVGYATDDQSSVAITAGNGSYTLAGSLQYSTVHWLKLQSTGEMLTKWTRAQLEAMYGDDPTRGIPTDWSPQENSSSQIEVRIRPIPIQNDTLLVFGSLVPAQLLTDNATIPFSEPMLSAMVKMVAADCVASATNEELAKLHTDRAVARAFRADGEAALADEQVRRNRLKRTGRIERVDA